MKKKLLISYIAISILFLLGVALTFYDYSYRGYYTDKIIAWTWFLSTIVIIGLYWQSKIAKTYLYTLISLLILSILPMGIPFLGIINYFTTTGDYQQIRVNKEFRIERTKHQALSAHRLYVYQSKGIFEKNICRPPYSEILDKVNNQKISMNDENLTINSIMLIEFNTDSIGFVYHILNNKEIIYHTLNNEDGY